MNTARASFPETGAAYCHRCRNTRAVGKDPEQHLCVPNENLYVSYGVNITDLFEKSDTLVGGFVHPKAYVIPGYTMMPCPLECIIGTNNERIWKIGQGASANGLCYIYLTRANCVLTFYKLDGTRQSARNLPMINRLVVYFNRFRNGLAIVEPPGNPGVSSGDGGLEA